MIIRSNGKFLITAPTFAFEPPVPTPGEIEIPWMVAIDNCDIVGRSTAVATASVGGVVIETVTDATSPLVYNFDNCALVTVTVVYMLDGVNRAELTNSGAPYPSGKVLAPLQPTLPILQIGDEKFSFLLRRSNSISFM